ncbi:MAG: exodeoxyribonuclease VII large subunit [Candidatus Goldbacteria bacterium]|nr:exodeoxyribonuclease VII large subunit [Candidatus Goldiibacteriota bacterium]
MGNRFLHKSYIAGRCSRIFKKNLIMSYLNEKPFTVTEINNLIKNLVEENLQKVWVKGEISNLSIPSSGHIYFTLKDAFSQIKVAFFKSSNKLNNLQLKDGKEVIVYGKISIYSKRSEYQIIAEEIKISGEGDLLLEFERLKKKLSDEGLFNENRKRPIPRFPEKIGIITSPTGAVIKDIIKIINRRYKAVEIIIYPSMVQGDEAAQQLIEGIKYFNSKTDIDVIILARGGGSIEDLWPFNDENLAREIYASKIPVISAVGHEVDFTIADFVADLRAPTPSAAAELVVPDTEELLDKLDNYKKILYTVINNLLENYNEKIKGYETNNVFRKILNFYDEYSQMLDDYILEIKKTIKNFLEKKEEKVKFIAEKLMLLNPYAILKKGYSVVFDNTGKIIKSYENVKKGQDINIRLHRGKLKADVTKIEP